MIEPWQPGVCVLPLPELLRGIYEATKPHGCSGNIKPVKDALALGSQYVIEKAMRNDNR